jgi:hypothetical protein
VGPELARCVHKTNLSISSGLSMPYNVIDFNEGGGSYDTSTYRYTFSVAGTYFIGESHTIGNKNGAGVVDFILI